MLCSNLNLNKYFQQTEAPEYELRTSNMAYVSNKLSVLSEFANTLKEKYLSSSKVVDFGESEAVRKEINDIVEKETNSKIKDLIPSGKHTFQVGMMLIERATLSKLSFTEWFPHLAVNSND